MFHFRKFSFPILLISLPVVLSLFIASAHAFSPSSAFDQRAIFNAYWVEKFLLTSSEVVDNSLTNLTSGSLETSGFSANETSGSLTNKTSGSAELLPRNTSLPIFADEQKQLFNGLEKLSNKSSFLELLYSGRNLSILAIEFEQTGKTQNLYLDFNDTRIAINSDLVWSLENCSLAVSDHVRIEGKTAEFKLSRIFWDEFSVQLMIHWTPMRDVISVQLTFGYQKSRLLAAPAPPLSLRLSSRNSPPSPNELRFLSLQSDASLTFSEVYQKELNKNYGSPLEELVNVTGLSHRRASCQLWLQINENLRETPQERELCEKVTDACNLAAYFVRKGSFFRVPNHCLSCSLSSMLTRQENRLSKFGNRTRVHGFKTAEIVYLLDGTCHRVKNPQATFRIIHQVRRLSKVIEKELRSRDIRVKVMAASPDLDGNFVQNWSHGERYFTYTHMLSREQRFWKSNHQLSNDYSSSGEDPFMQATWRTSGRSTMDFLLEFPYPPDHTIRHFVLLDCLHFDATAKESSKVKSTCQMNALDFSSARNMLLHSNTYLHLITGLGISPRGGQSSKLRPAIGIDWNRTYFDNATLSRLSNNRYSVGQLSHMIRPQIPPHRDDCHFLALETNGTIFNHHILKQANRAIFADRIAAYFVRKSNPLEQCQKCDCMLDKDKMFARQECVRCRDREHTIPISSSHTTSHIKQGTIEQEWTKEDDSGIQDGDGDDNWKEEVDEHL